MLTDKTNEKADDYSENVEKKMIGLETWNITSLKEKK